VAEDDGLTACHSPLCLITYHIFYTASSFVFDFSFCCCQWGYSRIKKENLFTAERGS